MAGQRVADSLIKSTYSAGIVTGAPRTFSRIEVGIRLLKEKTASPNELKTTTTTASERSRRGAVFLDIRPP